MKNIRLIFIVFIIVSCKSETAKSSDTLEHATESVEMEVEEMLVEKKHRKQYYFSIQKHDHRKASRVFRLNCFTK